MVASRREEGPGSLASVLALPLTRFQGPLAFPGGSVVKNPPVKQEMWVLSLVWKDSPGGGNGNPLQYSCLENSMDRGAGQAPVHGVTKSRT